MPQLWKTFAPGARATEIIRFFRYPRSTVNDDVAKYNASEKLEEGSADPTRNFHSRERVYRTSGKHISFTKEVNRNVLKDIVVPYMVTVAAD